MFDWLRRLFGLRDENPEVFHYHDDMARRSRRSADPIEVTRRMAAVLGEDWLDRVAAFKKPPPPGLTGAEADVAAAKREEERLSILAAVDAAFDVRAYEHPPGGRPSGLTDARRFGLLEGFNLFCLDLVEVGRPFPSAGPPASPGGGGPPPPSTPESTSPDIGSPASAPATSARPSYSPTSV